MRNATKLGRANFVMMTHLQYAWDRAVRDGRDPHLVVDREERIFTMVCALDPTSSGRYLSWLSRWRRQRWDGLGVANSPGSFELSRVSSALAHFEEIRGSLEGASRDVMSLRTVDDLMNAWASMPGQNVREQRRSRKRRAISESEFLFDERGWTLVRLLSRASAEWWGLGTRWCTSATFDNRFELYVSRGDLFVLVTPADRYQLFCGNGEFRDSADCVADANLALAGSPIVLDEMFRSLKTRHACSRDIG